MEGKCANSPFVSGFCFFNTGANSDPKQTRKGWQQHWEKKTLIGRVFKTRGMAVRKAQRKNRKWVKLSKPPFPHLYDQGNFSCLLIVILRICKLTE